MSQEQMSQEMDQENKQIIRFKVGAEEYGVEIMRVKEVIRIKQITQLPKTPSFVKGVINLRGDVIPVIDLREKFGLSEGSYSGMTRVIVVEVEGKSIGMVVDEVRQVLRIPSGQIEPPPALAGGLSGEFLEGVGKQPEDRLVILLSIDRILTTEEKLELEEMETSAAEAGVQ
ncbi:MAG: chemotaxis protein CheW [Spirochaetota bacterium]